MKLAYRLILIGFAVFISLIFLWAIFSPKDDLSLRINQTIKEQEKKADLVFKAVSFEEVDNGEKFWQINAVSATINKSTNLASLKDAHGTFFNGGLAILRFRAPAALWDMAKKEIFLDQPLGYDIALEQKIAALVAATKIPQRKSIFNLPVNGTKTAFWFLADNLSWKLADKKIVCRGDIVVKKGEVMGYSQKLLADSALEKVLISGQPKIIITPKKLSPITAEAEVFEILTPEDIITAQGSPKVFWQQAKISAQTIKYYAQLKQLEFLGQVRVNYQDIFAWGDKAIYDTVKNEIILAGNARAEQAGNKLQGEKVKVELNKNKISVLGKGKFLISDQELK